MILSNFKIMESYIHN